jgi:hypothetical protein
MTTTQAAPTTNAYWGFGATDDTSQYVTTISDCNGCGGSLKTVVNYTEYAHAFNVVYGNCGCPDATGDIQSGTGGSFDADGFTMDWTTNGNNVATEVTYLALGPLGATSVTLASFTATRLPDGKVRLDWRTGYEVDNVGFRLYREQDGKRVRITSSIVPGSALLGGGRGMSVGGRTYTWSDAVGAPPEAGPVSDVQYWLEDVDLKGKSTWHGPIVAAATTKPAR